jgi:chromosome segregation ATPase
MAEPSYTSPSSEPSGFSRIILPLLWGVVIALVGASVYLFIQVDRMRGELASMRQSVLSEVSKVHEASSLLDSANRRNLDALREELGNARSTAAVAAGQAKVEALRHADDIARKLDAEQKRQQQHVASELSAVREAANTTTSKIADVSTEVSSVRSEVASTKSELDKTISDLKSVRGDLGMQSGLIATNSKELSALRSLGDRNYFEFNLTKAKQMQKVGDVSIRVTKVDIKKNKYTIELVADDKRVEKKDKNINEPLQFYVAKVRTPYEIVVNEVRKDQIIGYLATPKVQTPR